MPSTLGWKLKGLISGQGDSEAIAESYFAERHPVAERVVHETSRLLHFGIMSNPVVRTAKKIILPIFSQLEPFKKRAAFELSGLGIAYSPGPLIAEGLSSSLPAPRLGARFAGSARGSAQGRVARFALARTSPSSPQLATILWRFSFGNDRWRDLCLDQRIPRPLRSLLRALAGGQGALPMGSGSTFS